MTEMQRQWANLKTKWRLEDEPAALNVVPLPKSKKMPRRVGKTERDRKVRALKASLAELTGVKV